MIVKHEKIKVSLLMLIAYIFLLIGVINSYPLHTSTDELGGIVGAAHFAGLDWSGIISNGGYYGFGYYSLFFWIFKITDSPLIIYRVIISITALIKVMIIPISYYILKNYLHVNSGYIYIIAFMMPFLHTSTVGAISNEYILELTLWLVIFLTCKIVENMNNWKLIIYSILLIFTCLYSLFIHTRALTLIIALILVFTIYGIIDRNKKVIFIVNGIIISYFISKKIIELYQNSIYKISGSEIRNGSVVVNLGFNLLDKNTWDVWFHMIVGLIGTESIITGGLLILGIVTVTWYLIYLFKIKRDILGIQGNMILAITVLCIGATIVAFCVSDWFAGMLATWGQEGASKNYAYKGLAYVRYWNIYVPPFIMCIIALLSKVNYKKIINISLLCLVVLYVLYIYAIIPLAKDNMSCASFLFGIGHYKNGFEVSADYYLKCIAISFAFTIIAYVIAQTKYIYYALFPFIILMLFFHINEQTEYNIEVKKQISEKITSSYNEKCKLDKQGIKIGTIYLNDETSGNDANWKIYSVAQFYFNRYTLQTQLPKVLEKNDIIISTNKSDIVESLYENINCYVLDNNEVWYTYINLPNY